jgi:hypothetical protein
VAQCSITPRLKKPGRDPGLAVDQPGRACIYTDPTECPLGLGVSDWVPNSYITCQIRGCRGARNYGARGLPVLQTPESPGSLWAQCGGPGTFKWHVLNSGEVRVGIARSLD